MIKNVVIVTDSTKIDFSYLNNDENIFIGVERGALDLIKKGIKIDYAISDFDKVDTAELKLIEENSKIIEKLNPEKDYLDGEIAIMRALQLNPKKIIFIANPTKRYDKNFSIVSLIFKYNILFINDDTTMFLLKNGKNEIDFNKYQGNTYVSFFSKERAVISINQMKYNVQNLILEPFENNAISNAFLPYKNPIIISDKDIICIISK